MRKVKKSLPSWRAWTPQLDRDDQSSWGLNHLETAFYLLSLEVDWDNKEWVSPLTHQTLTTHNLGREHRKFWTGEVIMSEFEYPRLCYNDGKGDKDYPWVGAFYGQLLIKVSCTNSVLWVTWLTGISPGCSCNSLLSRLLKEQHTHYDHLRVAWSS